MLGTFTPCKQHHLHGMCEHTIDCKQLYAAMFSFPFFQHKQTTLDTLTCYAIHVYN